MESKEEQNYNFFHFYQDRIIDEQPLVPKEKHPLYF